MSHELVLSEASLRDMAEGDCAAYWELDEHMRAERLPDDPPTPHAIFAARARSLPSFFDVRVLLARERAGGPLVAAANIGFDNSGENAHLGQLSIDVLPAHRRRGIGRRLLGWAVGVARAGGRRLLIASSSDHVPSGGAFLERAGATHGLEDRDSQLALAELDRSLLARWQADAAESAASFELLTWESGYPDDQIDAFANLCEVMNSAPRGELDVEDQAMTAAKLREFVASQIARGSYIWTIVAREVATGRLAGYSEVFGNPARPTILHQGATAVRPEFRGHRLGRWMKATMLEKILAERPDVRFVRTGNASSNAPMLAINTDLGFRLYMISTVWQLDVERAAAFDRDGQPAQPPGSYGR